MSGKRSNSREQILRIFKIIEFLLANRYPVSSQQILDNLIFEHEILTTLRTVQRDLEVIQSIGYKITTLNQSGYLLSRDNFASMIFTDSEIQALQMSRGIFNYFQGTYLKEQIDSAVSMITGSMDKNYTKAYLEELEESFMVHLGAHRDLASKTDLIDELFAAINGKWMVKIDYHRPGRETAPLRVEPYRIILYRDTLYLLARRIDETHLKVFHISRIENVAAMDISFERDKMLIERFEEDLSNCFGIFTYGEITETEITFDKSVEYALRERIWHSSQSISTTNETVTLKLRVFDRNEFISWILGWGKAVLKVEPQVLAEKVQQLR